jgi:hypothetical protein
MKGLPARTGIEWLKQGFGLFRQQPGILTMVLFANLLSYLLIGSLPMVGQLIMAVLIPSFSIAIMEACNQISQGKKAMPGVLLTGFRQPQVQALCKLGLVYVGLALLFTLLMRLNVSDEFVKQATTPITDPKMRPELDGGTSMRILLIVMMQVVILMLLCFAAPLTYWKQMPVFKAVFYSVFAVVGAIRPILTMLATWVGILMFAGVVMTFLFQGNLMIARTVIGWLLLMFSLVLQCSIFASYRQIFADPAPGVSLNKPL